MNQRFVTAVSVLAATIVLVTFFENCGKAFQPADHGSSSSASISPQSLNTTPHIQPDSDTLAPGENLTFSLNASTLPSTIGYQWSYTFNAATTGCAVVSSSATAPTYTVNCAQAGELIVSVQVLNAPSPVTVQPFDLMLQGTAPTPTPSPSPGPSPTPAPVASTCTTGTICLTVNFAIANGTGTGAWNTPDTVVETFIGQSLVLTNNDTVDQRLHTNGVPFPHGTLMTPGTSTNNVVASTYTLAANGPLYNHQVGQTAPFYMVAYDGGALYTANCAGCHGALGSSGKQGATPSQISAGIASVGAMQTSSLMALTTVQIQAIAYALGAPTSQ